MKNLSLIFVLNVSLKAAIWNHALHSHSLISDLLKFQIKLCNRYSQYRDNLGKNGDRADVDNTLIFIMDQPSAGKSKQILKFAAALKSQGVKVTQRGRKIWTRDFSDQILVHFGSPSQNVLKSDLKKSRICRILGQSDPLWVQIWYLWHVFFSLS